MPYINQAMRNRLDRKIDVLLEQIQEADDDTSFNPGVLNYVMTRLALRFVEVKGENYAILAQAIASFECAKLEFYARKVRPYEDRKIEENGDLPGYASIKSDPSHIHPRIRP